MATQAERYEACFQRFLTFSADAVVKYPELELILGNLTKVTSFSVFILFFKSSSDSHELIDICRNADEEYQTTQVNRLIGVMLSDHELDPDRFDTRDRQKLVKYLRLFGEISLNGL